ncbi:hypothetical protein LWI28_008328 [Acer negundo]|uniref:Uncharacterized protein n=1 Tax=Acer negundo TaxID=4023 RepID=A0AAD5NIJ8_ACENE|nr:hypothetical protein LWI28_008328 [Acer negundo]
MSPQLPLAKSHHSSKRSRLKEPLRSACPHFQRGIALDVTRSLSPRQPLTLDGCHEKCEIVTNCDVIAILDFYDLARRFGYYKDYEAWYVVSGLGLEHGLVKIITNDNVEQMNHALNPDRRVDAYIQGTRVEHDEADPSNMNQFENVEAEEAEHDEWKNYVEEPKHEYQQEEKPKVVEHNDAYVVDGEKHNERENDEQENSRSETDESQFDD